MKEGILVECIGDFPQSELWGLNVPKKGNIYTIRKIEKYSDGGVGLILEELRNELEYDYYEQKYLEPCFIIEKFREIQPPMTIDINEIIKELV